MIADDPVILTSYLVRARHVATALNKGIPNSRLVHVEAWKEPVGSICLHYGLAGRMVEIREANLESGIPDVLFDLGYYGRLDGPTRWDGYHRYAINAFHGPLPGGNLSFDRISRWVPKELVSSEAYLQERHPHVLLVGMSEKACQVYGLEYGEWDRWALQKIKNNTDRRVIYYPKPGSKDPYYVVPKSTRDVEIWIGPIHAEADRSWRFNRAWCVIAHHSNLTARAQVWGIPIITSHGVAKDLSIQFSRLYDPPLVDVEIRRDFLARLGYLQWSVAEMADGPFWRHLTKTL